MDIKNGAFLIPTSTPLGNNGESGLDFVAALGGDKDTFLLLVSSPGEPGISKAMPVGTGGFFRPKFTPNWDEQQLTGEIARGIWNYIPPGHQEFPTWVAEMDRRIMQNFKDF